MRYSVYRRFSKAKAYNHARLGLPLNFDGTNAKQTEYTQYFIDRLKENIPISIETADERLTTVEAHKTLIEQDYSREKRKQFVDALAATYILEGYLRKQQQNKN